MTASPAHDPNGPFYDDLRLGDVCERAPGVTLTDGLAAAHHAIVGGRMKLYSDHGLATRIAGGAPLAPPGLVWDVAIGQSTPITQRVIANLFYRGLVFRACPRLGDTLTTTATVVGLRPVSAKPARPPRGIVVIHIVTRDQNGRVVLDFHRCALLPAREEAGGAPQGDLEPPSPGADWTALAAPFAGWRLDALGGDADARFSALQPGTLFRVEHGDVVSSAPELARLTFNLAAVHHDEAAGGARRLVYGGHTIGLALAQISRALPDVVTVVGWHGCDHTGPVHEGDTLVSEIGVERCEPLASGGLVHLRSRVAARPAGSTTTSDVLDWRLVALVA